jgi:nucleotide-binding universal stress UspA family protein
MRSPRMVVGVDDSTGARVALRWALRQAQATGATVDVVRIYDFGTAWIDLDQGAEEVAEWRGRTASKARVELHRVVDEAIADLAASEAFRPPPDVQALIVEGHPAQLLVDLAKEADLLVVGSRGRGRLGGLVLGSISQHCVERASCPTAVVMADAPIKRIVVGVDGSQSAQAALAWAVQEAAVTGACVDAVCAYIYTIALSHHALSQVPFDERLRQDAWRVVDEAISGLADTRGVTINPIVCEGQPADVLVACATDADLVVLGTRGLGSLKGLLLGSVTRRVMTRVACPIVVVPAPFTPKPQTLPSADTRLPVRCVSPPRHRRRSGTRRSRRPWRVEPVAH